jgi:hypothetical protein
LVKKYKKQLDDLQKTKNKLIQGSARPQETENLNASFIQSSENPVTESEYGIPNYWKKVIMNCKRFKGVLNHKDIKILSFLKGIYVFENNDKVYYIT